MIEIQANVMSNMFNANIPFKKGLNHPRNSNRSELIVDNT